MENMQKDPAGFKKMMSEMLGMSVEELNAQEKSGEIG